MEFAQPYMDQVEFWWLKRDGMAGAGFAIRNDIGQPIAAGA